MTNELEIITRALRRMLQITAIKQLEPDNDLCLEALAAVERLEAERQSDTERLIALLAEAQGALRPFSSAEFSRELVQNWDARIEMTSVQGDRLRWTVRNRITWADFKRVHGVLAKLDAAMESTKEPANG